MLTRSWYPKQKRQTLRKRSFSFAKLKKLVILVRSCPFIKKQKQSVAIAVKWKRQSTFSLYRTRHAYQEALSQGSMQGTAPSYGSGWQGLSAMDMYSQAAHPLCTPFISSTLNPVGSLPPFGSLSGGSDARLPAPWFSGLSMPTSSSADYLQHIQNGISSYLPHKWSEQSSHLGDKAYAVENHSNLFQNTRTPSSTLDLHLNTDNLIYSTTKLPSLPAKSNKFQSVLEEKSFEAFEKRQNSFDFIPYENSTSCSTSLPNTSMAPMLISSRPQELPSYSASSETKYKNAIFSKLSGMENATSSREQMLYKDAGYVTTSSVPSFSKPVNNTHHSKVISYYSDPREKDLFNNTSSNEKASIEAARIVQEAHDSDMNFKHQAATNRAITSPFMNISNQHRQQIPSFKSTDLQNTARAFHHPLPESHISKKSTHSASFRPENLISGNHERPPSVNITSVETDFWSQFGLPPPNVEIKTPSAARSTFTSEATSVSGNSLNFADKSSKPAKKKNKTTTEHNEQTNENGALRQMIESKRKSPKSDNRRGIFVPNPEIDALVHAKVHEIMAAVRQKEHSGNEDDNKGCKSKSENPEATRPQVATSMFQSDSKSIINDKYLGFQRDSTNSDVFFVEDRERENSTKHELFTQHTSVSSRELQEKKYLFDTVQDIMEKKKHSSVNREPAEKKNMSDSQVSHNKNQSGTTLQYVNHSIEAMIKPLTTPHDGYMDSSPMKKLNRQVNSMRKVKQEHGRFTPCCGNCEKVGVMFSENCQHFKCYDRKLSGIQAENKAQDPYAFSDEFSDFKPPLTGYKFLNNSYQKPEDSHFKYYQPAQTIDLPKSEVKYSGSYLHAHRKDIKEDVNVAQQKINSFKSDKSHFKSTKPSFKLEKPLNQKLSNHLLKKNNVPYGIKSSNALLKRSKLHGKLPTVRQKWRNNPKYMARHKDDTDFAKKLMKNLGFPPLTLEDLVTKSKKLTLPKSYFSGSKSSIASSVLHAEHKIESRDRVSPKTPDNSVLAYQLLSLNNDKSSFTGNERQEHFQTSAMPRSTHLESCINTTESATPLLTSRSHSFENPRHCFYDDTDKISQTDLKIGVDNNMPQSFANVDMHQMSSQ
ncbi:hypothetical protein DPMN_025974 [Dreissena polymorpha]|uniref:Uncharacterized protein n=1 Tax=Dreissena polymorpha TaxID=45954 RepID=A0A9D4LSI0_DREPO|nr:hypothetical protein DPMN_025974 [Dreissena polymorpha]